MALADGGPNSDSATRSLRQHWGGEEGTAAGEALESATNAEDATALVAVMEQYPDWVEPINRLATRRYRDGDVAEAIQLFLRVVRMKPWHFGALHGILMPRKQLGNEEEADRGRRLACHGRQTSDPSGWRACCANSMRRFPTWSFRAPVKIKTAMIDSTFCEAGQ